MKYIIPENLIDQINIINNSSGIFAIPCSNEFGEIIIDVDPSWPHYQFVLDNNLQPDLKSEVVADKEFCKKIQIKLLSAFKAGPTLNQGTYRQLSDIFWYAKDAADNGNPTNLKVELQAIPNEETLGLTGWDALRASLIAEIDNYLSQ